MSHRVSPGGKSNSYLDINRAKYSFIKQSDNVAYKGELERRDIRV